MPSDIKAVTVTMVKSATGNVNIFFYDGVIGSSIRFYASIPTADFTSFNTTVNGGSAGTSLSKTYAQNSLSRTDIPHDYVEDQ